MTAPYGDGRFGGLFELPSSRHRLLVKLTHQFDSQHQLAVKAAFSERDSLESVGGFDIFDNRLETLNEDASVYATFVSEIGSGSSELRFGFARERFRTRGQKPPLGAVEIHPTLGNIGNPIRFQRADEDHLEVSETLTLPTGNHNLKTGFNFLRIGSTSELERYSDGVLFFPPTDVQGPLLLWQNFTGPDAETVLERSESHVQVFFQDDWQVTPFFTVNRRCCTARSKLLTSLCRWQSHPAQYVSGIPSAVILLSISHPIRCSTRCLANVRVRISGPMIAL